MDTCKKDRNELKSEDSWIPNTPSKPIISNRQENQIDNAVLFDNSSSFSNWRVENVQGCNNGATCEFVNWEHSLLLAIQHQEAAAAASHNHQNTQGTQDSQHGLPIPRGPAIDLNLPHWGNSIATPQVAPVTPEKGTREECKQEAHMQCSTYESTNQGSNEQANASVITAVDSDSCRTCREPHIPGKDTSLSFVSSTIEESHKRDKESSVTDVIKTPEKKPRRKRHRPKVITESKPRTRKQETPKHGPSDENKTGKRSVQKKPCSEGPSKNPAESTETLPLKKYVRRKSIKKLSTPPVEATRKYTNKRALDPTQKSSRRTLNFDTEGQHVGNCKHNPSFCEDCLSQVHKAGGGRRSKSTMDLGYGIEVIVETDTAYGLARPATQMLQDYISLPKKQAPSTPQAAKTCLLNKKWNESSQESNAIGEDQVTGHNAQQDTAQVKSRTVNQLPPANQNDSNTSYRTLTTEGQANGSKSFLQQPGTCSKNQSGVFYNALYKYQVIPWLGYQSIYKKRRTEKTHNATTSSTCLTALKGKERLDISGPQNTAEVDHHAAIASCLLPSHTNAEGVGGPFQANSSFQYKIAPSVSISAQTGRSTRKRSSGLTRARDLASLAKIARESMCQNYTIRGSPMDNNSNRSRACIDALAKIRGTLTTKKRTRKRSLVNSASSSANAERPHGKIIVYKQNQFPANSLGTLPDVTWSQMLCANPIDEAFQKLDINREGGSSAYEENRALVPYYIGNEQQNALVLYRSSTSNEQKALVPYYTGNEQQNALALYRNNEIKKKRPRPKVYLDEETNKVWELLMGNINDEGIDGTDEDKAKFWEEERNVFCGRANSFIARMRLMQGDRRFSQWKGSVVDSVVGVFLTQNVSDHLSSSAFMSLAAHFPLKSQSREIAQNEERIGSVIDKPIVCIPNPANTIKWKEEISSQSTGDQTSMTVHDSELDKEYSNESSTSSFGIISSSRQETYCDSMENISTAEIINTPNAGQSPHDFVDLSQSYMDSPLAQTAGEKEASSENYSEAGVIVESRCDSLNSCTSFMQLLEKATCNKLHEVHSDDSKMVFSDQNSQWRDKAQTEENDFHMQIRTTKLFQRNTEEIRCSNEISTRNVMKEPSSLTEEFLSQTTDESNLTMPTDVLVSPMTSNPPCSQIDHDMPESIQTQSKELNTVTGSLLRVKNNDMQQILCLPNLSEETLDTLACSSKPEKNLQKVTESNMNETDLSRIKEHDEKNAARKAKTRRVGKEIRDDVDWDTLRKEAEANGGKRERTPNTMDSLDWEAVRCADVNEIANTIKDRGMNNVLAERIKNFLNRLVREHGSIDLEWLRGIPPERAKEYLLSIKGLGLKSVECVRLLTLHHLAFPVDTNVGRIAVRLGWVPLQPLPESLQLHLLELYPVLESIQKYLWPRLCKLDQRTLYELHYQMITFGKVFCTKSKPNCNACPLRGECRHFASAFASARLALPGPEEKGIVIVTNKYESDPNSDGRVGKPLFPLPPATKLLEEHQLSKLDQISEARSGIRSHEPIIEEPLSPEPERIQVTEQDIEDAFYEDPDEIPTIKLNIEEFTQNLQNYMQNNMELQERDMSKALVALTAEAASIPMPKLKNVSRLRTEHQVYELPDSHPLLQGVDKREPDDPCSFLLAIWTPGETAESIQPPESSCNSHERGNLCHEKTCFSCNSIREADSQIVRGTLLIPCRTAMRGSFPLNGTYFQVNEVFADHESSLNPMDVPRSLLWNLPRRTVYFGTSIPTIFKGLTTEDIQRCFWRGFVCVRGFDQKTRAPRPLMARLHFPASKLNKSKGKESNG